MISNYYAYYYLISFLMFIGVNSFMFASLFKRKSYVFIFGLVCVVVISLFFGVRDVNIGIDTRTYHMVFMGDSDRDDEILFVFLASLIRFFTNDSSYFFITIALVINVSIYMAAYKITTNNLVLMALIFSSFIYLNINISVIRQGVAISFVFLACSYLLHGHYKKYLLFCMLATLFHTTAIISFVFYFVIAIKASKRNVLIYLTLLFFVSIYTFSDFVFLIKGFHPYLERVYWYFNWERLTPWHIKHVYYFVFLMAFFYFYVLLKNRFSNMDESIFKLFLFGIFLVLTFRQEEMVADRIFYYFMLPGMVLFIHMYKYVGDFLQYKISNLGCFYFFWLVTNAWLFKTYFLQYPNWFLPPFSAIGGH